MHKVIASVLHNEVDMKQEIILHLIVTEYWFNKIESGQKTNEYREIKPYWISRLVRREVIENIYNDRGLKNIFREYDLVKIKVGYNKNSRKLVRRFGGTDIALGGDLGNFPQFRIKLENL